MRQGLFLLQGGEKYFVEDSGVDSGACAPPCPVSHGGTGLRFRSGACRTGPRFVLTLPKQAPRALGASLGIFADFCQLP